MEWFRWTENKLQIFGDDRTIEIVFPEIQAPNEMFHPPVFSADGRYIAVADSEKIYAYDLLNGKHLESPGKFRNVTLTLRFDARNRIYYCDCNHIGRWDLAAQKIEPLYTMSRVVHGPESLGISPDCRYVSFCKYRSSSYYLYVYDTETKQCMDMKLALYRYAWLDETHIVWTGGSGLRILDIESGKSSTPIKDWSAIYKKSKKHDADLLNMFCGKARGRVNTDIALLGVKDGRIMFSLWVSHYYRENEENFLEDLKSIEHRGVWSAEKDGTNPAFCYADPDIDGKAVYKAFREDGSFFWKDEENLHIFDGKAVRRMDLPCSPVRYYEMRNR